MSVSQAGQAGSFNEFFHRTNRRAYVFALHLSGNREDAMDILQEAYLRMHRRWSECEGEAKAVAWLYTIVRNLALDRLRRRARRAEAEIQESILSSSADGPERAAAREELSRRLWDAIRKLPAEQREILLLRDWHGLNYSEIAQVLGLSLGTVSSRIHHAREKIREAMEDYLR